MMLKRLGFTCAWLALVAADAPDDLARRFGAREDVVDLSLSPDGGKIAYVSPTAGQGAILNMLALGGEEAPQRVTAASGDPERLQWCNWAASDRLVCQVYGLLNAAEGILPFWRLIAVDETGKNVKMLSNRTNSNSRGLMLDDGTIVDWLPDENGTVLMARYRLPDDRIGSRVGSSVEGLGVDLIDTRTLTAKRLETPKAQAQGYVTDGRGAVRIVGMRTGDRSDYDNGITRYMYRKPGAREWERLGDYDRVHETGFLPYAVDHDRNLAFGFKRVGGRLALASVALDGTLQEDIVLQRPDVDVDGLIRIGRRARVVGASYATDVRTPVYFDPEIKALAAQLSKALPNQPLVRVVDSSVDEGKLLIFAGSDNDPGTYYLLDRKTKQMRPLVSKRMALEGLTLARQKPITYPAADGTPIPGYLTLPPGKESAKGLPAIVLPHGGPQARDEWGFDWLSQYFAARGYAVLQPNFRGSSGYGDAWFQQNGFQSWKVAVGDVMDGGRWLVKQGIADPAKLGIVGWSYGGYAALQSAVTDPGLFKAVVAVAPVTDLAMLKEQSRFWSNFRIVSDFIGTGPHIREGSPAQNAARIKAPVLLFHGGLDRNVDIRQSRFMDDRLKDAGVRHELVTWPKLDHQLEDSAARAQLLARSDAFLRAAMGMAP